MHVSRLSGNWIGPLLAQHTFRAIFLVTGSLEERGEKSIVLKVKDSKAMMDLVRVASNINCMSPPQVSWLQNYYRRKSMTTL